MKALLVIDMQNGFLHASSPLFIAGAPATVPACQKVIDFCRSRSIPVFFVTRRYTEATVERCRYGKWASGGKPLSPGCAAEISADMPFSVLPGDYELLKPRYSAFFATALDLILRRLQVDELILTGTTTPNCIRATCVDGLSLDYEITVLSDCTSSVTEEIQQSNLRDMENIGARILSSDSWMREQLIQSPAVCTRCS
ncbi:MAG: cysteine hydrolase [Oscillospiraceae bacterium]|nr:cysteine hydrolase [Oscillospiraceae bacterium]